MWLQNKESKVKIEIWLQDKETCMRKKKTYKDGLAKLGYWALGTMRREFCGP